MWFDIVWKLLRKALPKSLYDFLSYVVFRRRMNYERLETYFNILSHYQNAGVSFRGMRVCEIGSGLQLYSALKMLDLGADLVHLVEPKFMQPEKLLDSQWAVFEHSKTSALTKEQARSRLRFSNDLGSIPESNSFDWACSYTVLEHVSDLNTLHKEALRLLNKGGRAYHLVDLTDHTYQFFARFPWLRDFGHRRVLFHLRYSEKFFSLLNDPKCYMNRRLPSEHRAAAMRAGFTLEKEIAAPYPLPFRIHPDLLTRAEKTGAQGEEICTLALWMKKPA